MKACYDVQSFSGIYFDVLQFWYSTWAMLWSWHKK